MSTIEMLNNGIESKNYHTGLQSVALQLQQTFGEHLFQDLYHTL